ncbi:ribonuclease T2 family protein [Oceaniovalibus guishaninsula JLT2003]|uniref:Ribonuclease T2 family protein n=1 Tax=Oceaniovalibus guishaninsula JLT2003 TaxID=1231392 RepID=K2HM90_9RHOB|nr:ribonuclease T2 [Oceaniovalibus guishaninsula]EKE43994.1 ribonuclease T2 family protein [Oceaniovalibus guishaninsula JLT2003]
MARGKAKTGIALALLLLAVGPAKADDAGVFDYWILALSWQPTWCALEGDARGAEQCNRSAGWVLHGLWPQYERGWPEYCATDQRDPTRAETGAMADIMGDGGAAWYQWKKHGRCAGVAADEYFGLARQAYDAIARPAVFRQMERPLRMPASVVEEAFMTANPALFADAVTITCKGGRIAEARICLSRDGLTPRTCGNDAIRDCRMTDALLDPVR